MQMRLSTATGPFIGPSSSFIGSRPRRDPLLSLSFFLSFFLSGCVCVSLLIDPPIVPSLYRRLFDGTREREREMNIKK